MSLQMIPLNNSPNQQFTIQVTIDGTPLQLNVTIKYNEMAGYWTLAILDSSNNLVLDSIPLVTGKYPAGNLLEQQRYLRIGSWYIVNVSNLKPLIGEIGYGQGFYGQGPYGGAEGESGLDYPSSANLGTDFQLWIDDTPSV